MTTPTAEVAIEAARAGVWRWRPSKARLEIIGGVGGHIASLNGEWSLPEFLQHLEGLNRTRLEALLVKGAPGDQVDETAHFKDGDILRFVGVFDDRGDANGLIYSNASLQARAAANVDLVPVYQKILDARTLKVVGFEALARWRGADGLLAGPEELASLGKAADWLDVAPQMIASSARALTTFRAAAGDVYMQVNLSAAEIARARLVEDTAKSIRDHDLSPGLLRIELTEQAALRDADRALGAMSAFRAAGAGLILDDFGAGYSSLAWLIDIPADGVKLDQKLSQMALRPRGFIVIKAMVRLAHDLNLTVTAEGVESQAQAHALAQAGCDYLQGFHYGTPLELEPMLSALKTPVA